MISLLRKYRINSLFKNKLGRYLLYALGEILLVVIGILIALQVNNNNETRKDRTFEYKMLTEVGNALEADMKHYIQMSERMKDLRKVAHFFVDYMADEKPMHDTLFNKFFALNGGISIQTNEGPYSAIKAVGLDKISNDSLRNQLIRFYDFTYPKYIESLEHYDRNSVQDIDRIVGFLENPYIFQRNGENLLAQDFNKDMLYDPNFHKILRSIFFRTNSLIRVITNFTPVMNELVMSIEEELKKG
jgi:hypothetical protein